MSIARWLQERPIGLEKAYRVTAALIRWLEPVLRRVGFGRLEGLFQWGERVLKGSLFDCRMCGTCNLRGTGMTCPMSCPKNLRNGPCGGVRQNGKCEVMPEMDCVWALAWKRASQMETYGDRILQTHPPLDRSLEQSSAWLNMLNGHDEHLPEGWERGGANEGLISPDRIRVLAHD